MSGRVERLLGQVVVPAGEGREQQQEQKETITVIDNRTGRSYELAIDQNTIRADALAQITRSPGDTDGLRSYDPGYSNTASAKSSICCINGEQGELTYRGYPIEQLADRSTFLEVAFLLIYGSLPDQDQLSYWTSRIMHHTFIHEDLSSIVNSYRYDAHPMGIFISAVSALSTLHPEANPAVAGQGVYQSATLRNKQIHRLLGTMPTIAALAYRHRIGRPAVHPSNAGHTYTGHFLFMLDHMSNASYRPHPRLARALDTLFILHAEHEMNCSTAAMRHLASGGVDVHTCIAGAAAALYGPKHGGANEAVLRMLESIGSVSNIPSFIADVKARKVRLMGFGHRVYKNYDPRARIIRQVAEEVFAILGREPLIEVAIELERCALADPFFVKRKLYPNVDFYSGLIYKTMGFPASMFPVLFAIPRTVGWLAHWLEFMGDDDGRIVRPRQIYTGEGRRDYIDMTKRPSSSKGGLGDITSDLSAGSKRRFAAGSEP